MRSRWMAWGLALLLALILTGCAVTQTGSNGSDSESADDSATPDGDGDSSGGDGAGGDVGQDDDGPDDGSGATLCDTPGTDFLTIGDVTYLEEDGGECEPFIHAWQDGALGTLSISMQAGLVAAEPAPAWNSLFTITVFGSGPGIYSGTAAEVIAEGPLRTCISQVEEVTISFYGGPGSYVVGTFTVADYLSLGGICAPESGAFSVVTESP